MQFEEISSPILEKVIQYFHYKYKYQQLLDNNYILKDELPEFQLEPELALDVIIAADALKC